MDIFTFIVVSKCGMNQDALCRCVDTIGYIHHDIQGYREMCYQTRK